MKANTNRRRLEVIDVVKTYGRITPDEVIKVVAKRLDQDPKNMAFKKSIYRDLKMLEENQELGVNYRTAAGELVHPDDEEEKNNLRLEYYDLASTNSIPGGKLLDQFQVKFFTPLNSNLSLKVCENLEQVGDTSHIMTMNFAIGTSVHISIPESDIPLTVVFARNAGEKSPANTESLEKFFGIKSCYFLVGDRSMSRIKEGEQIGHFALKFFNEKLSFLNLSQNKPVKLSKNNSMPDSLFLNFSKQETTFDKPDNPNDWSELDKDIDLSSPVLLKIGLVQIYVQKK